MAILRYIFPLFISFLLTGCYEDFIPEIDSKPVLCLNSLITAGEPIEVDVSHTWVYNDKEAQLDHSVYDATVTILVNDKIVGLDYLPEEGDHIRIVADSPSYGKATAEVVVPYAAPIGNVKITPSVTNIWKGDEDFFQYELLADITFNLNIDMDVEDPATEINYYNFGYDCFCGLIDNDGIYECDLTSPVESSFFIGQFEYDAEPIFKEHIGVFETIMGNDEGLNFMFFSDRQFSGKTYPLHLRYTNCGFRVNSKQYDESLLDCGVNLHLYTVSQSYYYWAVYKWNADEGILGDLSDIGLAESKWGYSNVSTGAGVVAAQSSTKYTVNLKEFLKSAIKQYKSTY